jgi:HEAT repeat protein
MTKLFFAGAASVFWFFVAAAMADDQKTEDLIKGLAGGNETARLRAIDTLGEEGEISPEAIDVLAAQLKDPLANDSGTRRPCAEPFRPGGHSGPQ